MKIKIVSLMFDKLSRFVSYHAFILCYILFIMVLCGCASDAVLDAEAILDQDVMTRDNTVHVALDSELVHLDPHRVKDKATRHIVHHIYEPLVVFDDQFNVQPVLAKSYEINEANKSITFQLREGVMFHHGEEMRAVDVIASLDRWVAHYEAANPYFKGMTFASLGDYTVIAHFKQPVNLEMLANSTSFAAIMPKEIAEETDELSDFIGTGPYQFSEWQKNNAIHLKRFTSYEAVEHQAEELADHKHAHVEQIYFQFVADGDARVAGLRKGVYDVIEQVPYEHVPLLALDHQIKSELVYDNMPTILFNKHRLFSEQRLRQAVTSRLDFEALLKAAYRDAAFYNLNPALIPYESSISYTEMEGDSLIKQDTERARELLREANYIGEDIHLLTTSAQDDLYQIAIAIQQQLREIGMNVFLDAVDELTFRTLLHDPAHYDLAVVAVDMSTHPTDHLLLDQTWQNWVDHSLIGDHVESLLAATGAEAVKFQLNQLQTELWQSLPFIKLGQKKAIYAYRSELEGAIDMNGEIALWQANIVEH